MNKDYFLLPFFNNGRGEKKIKEKKKKSE